MSFHDARLEQLQREIARKRQLEAQREELRAQQQQLAEKVQTLEACSQKEQADVDRLEGRSLSAYFYHVIGRMDEKLTRERQEAYAARVKCDAAVRELDAVTEDLERREAELAQLSGCEERYQQALRDKADFLKSAGGQTGSAIRAHEERLAVLSHQATELEEACAAGRESLDTVREILNSLSDAEGWGTMDLVAGSLISSIAKHNHLDDAQYLAEKLQVQLRRFKTELADVDIQADLQLRIDGFLRFTDIFFDNFFTDWAVLDRIQQSSLRVRQTRDQIEEVLQHLETLLQAAQQEERALRRELEEMVREASAEGAASLGPGD